MRDTIFLSHANPEDNQFTLWLALRLVREGYRVWCDLTNLIGGETFWTDIEMVIREKTAKLVYVTSKTSNHKPGPNKELSLAINVARSNKLHDFVIPLLIDDLPYQDLNIHLNSLNCISLQANWARGLARLLEKLETDGLPKADGATPFVVSTWWQEQFAAAAGVMGDPEEYVSNHFSVVEAPSLVHLYTFEGCPLLSCPSYQHKGYAVTFAAPNDIKGGWKDHVEVSVDEFLAGNSPIHVSQASRTLSHLMRVSWERTMREKGLAQHLMANNMCCYFFPKNLVPQDKVYFQGVAGRTFRQMVGYNTKRNATEPRKEYWHFGIEAKVILQPSLRFAIKPHVVFSDDGLKVWTDKMRLHRARRSECKDWWNPHWRDRILAAVQWLAGDAQVTSSIPVSDHQAIRVSAEPLQYTCPVSYADPDEPPIPVDELDDEDPEWDAEEGEQG